jgi:hypothetical protein
MKVSQLNSELQGKSSVVQACPQLDRRLLNILSIHKTNICDRGEAREVIA